jgi:AcrR family transcriptional regulator
MADAVKGTRRYSSPRRVAQARQTRRRVIDAATRLFVADGYGATTLQAVADEAEVAVQTIYATFGTKRQLLAEVVDVAIAGDDEPLAVNDRDWMHGVFTDPDPARRLTAYAAAVRRIHERAAAVFGVVAAAGAADPAVRPFADETATRRRIGARSVVDGLAVIDALRPDLTVDEATDVLWTLNGPEVFDLLVRESGWDPERYEVWLADALVAALLRSGVRS